MKKYIITFLIIILVAAGAAYYFLNGRTSPSTTDTTGSAFPTSDGARDLGNGTSGGSSFPVTEAPNTTGGDNTNTGTDGGTTGTSLTPDEVVSDVKVGRKVSDGPVSGLTSFGTSKDLNITVRYVDQDSGNIWDYHPIGDTKERVSQATILRVKEVLWGNGGQTALFRYFDDKGEVLKNYVQRIQVGATSSSITSGYFLPENLVAIVTAPAGGEKTDIKTKKTTGTKLSYLTRETSGTYNLVTTDFDKKPTASPYFSNFGEWLVSWPTPSTYLFVTKPASGVNGFAYTASANVSGKNSLLPNLKPLLRNIPGLTVNMNPAGTLAIYTRTSSRSISNNLLNIKTGEERRLPISTLVADKCVWDKKMATKLYCAVPSQTLSGSSLENWYVGALATIDSIYALDITTDTLTLLYKPDSPLDMAKLVISDDSSFLFFQDRNDGYLWALQLTTLKP